MKNNTKKTLKIYSKHIGRYKFSFLAIMFFLVVASVGNSIAPLYFKKFFDILSSGDTREVIVQGLFGALIAIGVIELIQWLSWRSAAFLVIGFQSKIMFDIANSCFKYVHKHSFSFFNDNFVGSLVKRVNYFVNAFESLSDVLFFQIINLLINLVIITTVLFFKNTILGLITLGWLIFFMILNTVLANHRYKYDVLKNKAESKATGFLADTVSNNSNVKLFNGYSREVKSYEKLEEKVRKLKVFSWRLMEASHAVQGLLMIGLELGLFYMAIRLWERGMFTIGDFVLIQSYVLIIFMKVWNLGYIIRETYRSLAQAEEMTDIFNTPHGIVDAKNAKGLKVDKGLIEFKEVDFNYHKTRNILSNFNLIIKSRERVALIGPSGAGKSTVAKIILRNYDISSGKILIDGQKISKVTLESLWANVGLVPQDPILFHRTLRENIRYGKPDASDKEVEEAARFANCHEFIKDFPEGYETYVGERGVKLSGGERQRVAIARAILKNSPILILDEATSSLDSHSEKLIQDALEKLMKDKTVIVIAHRLSTIRKMDRIIFIDRGKIVEEGTHKELEEKKDGQYSKLWNLQVGGFIK